MYPNLDMTPIQGVEKGGYLQEREDGHNKS